MGSLKSLRLKRDIDFGLGRGFSGSQVHLDQSWFSTFSYEFTNFLVSKSLVISHRQRDI